MSRADHFLLTTEELRLRRVRRRRWLFGAIGLVLVLLLGAFGARPASHAIKAWQARRHARQAFEFIAAEKWSEAQKEATAAYQLAPNEPEATRAVARFLSRLRQPQALEFWERLAKRQPLTREDLRDRASVALALNEMTIAGESVQALLGARDGGPAATDWLLAAQWAAQQGAPDEAGKDLAKLFADPRATDRQQFQAAAFQLMISGNLEVETAKKLQADAWTRLTRISQGRNTAALDALVLLAQRALGGTTAVSSQSPGGTGDVPSPDPNTDATAGVPPALAHALETHPLATAPQHLLAIDLRIRASPNEKAALIQAAVDRWKNGEVKSLVALATWLNGRGEYQRQLDTISMARAVQDRDLFLQRLDALGALGRWPEIKQALNSERFPLDPMISNMYLARCNAQLGEKTAAENNWQRALEACASEPQKLLTLADYAEKNGAITIAASAYDTAIASAPKLRVAWQGKLRLAQAERETKKIHAVLAEMLKIWPNDTAIQNDEAYTRLLLIAGGTRAVASEFDDATQSNALSATAKSEMSSSAESRRNAVEGEAGLSNLKSESGTRAVASESVATASELLVVSSQLSAIEHLAADLVRREPASLPHRTLLALARLKDQRPIAALNVYGIEVPQNVATPSAIAVRGAVLEANGRHDEAADLIRDLPRHQLMPEERALIENIP